MRPVVHPQPRGHEFRPTQPEASGSGSGTYVLGPAAPEPIPSGEPETVPPEGAWSGRPAAGCRPPYSQSDPLSSQSDPLSSHSDPVSSGSDPVSVA